MLIGNPENWPALNYLNVKPDDDEVELFRLPEIPNEHLYEAYWECDSHPGCVERVWDVLGESIPDDCKAIVNGVNCLLHDQSYTLLAVCMGTQYAIRVPRAKVNDAEELGLPRTCDWSGSQDLMDLRQEFGPNWFFGSFLEEEKAWTELAYRELK